MILAIYKSQKTGMPVKLPLKDFKSTDMEGAFWYREVLLNYCNCWKNRRGRVHMRILPELGPGNYDIGWLISCVKKWLDQKSKGSILAQLVEKLFSFSRRCLWQGGTSSGFWGLTGSSVTEHLWCSGCCTPGSLFWIPCHTYVLLSSEFETNICFRHKV